VGDREILLGGAFLRSLGTGMVGVLLGIYLARSGFDPQTIGLIVAAGLTGATLAALVLTVSGDRLGRKRSLIVLALLGATGGAVAALGSSAAIIGVAAFCGMLNGMGRDRTAAAVIDQAVLPGTAAAHERTRVFAWYSFLQDGGGALGSLLASLPAVLTAMGGLPDLLALRWTLGLYSALSLITALLYMRLSAAIEVVAAAEPVAITPETRAVVTRLGALFSLDGLGSGFLTTSLLSYFFFERFGVNEAALGPLFFAGRLANALSYFGATWLSKRIGLVNTMVFTHIPSSLVLVAVAFAPSFPLAAALFLLREALVEMDVPTRSSYVMAVVKPQERTYAAGVTQLVRLAAWAAAPTFAGMLMKGGSLMTPILLGSGLKISYDLLLYAAFRRLKPPEEREVRQPGGSNAT
jgi:MFS family permease